MDRRVILVAAAVLFGFGLLLAFLLCRPGNNEEVAAPRPRGSDDDHDAARRAGSMNPSGPRPSHGHPEGHTNS